MCEVPSWFNHFPTIASPSPTLVVTDAAPKKLVTANTDASKNVFMFFRFQQIYTITLSIQTTIQTFHLF
jgi:hypothetical protein